MRRFGPKKWDHPSIGTFCSLCEVPFVEGDFTTLMPGVPADAEEQVKADSGQPHTAIAYEVHWDCWEEIRP